MKTSPSTLLLLVISLLSISLLSNASLEDACRTVESKAPGIPYDFCVTSLQVDPESSSADNLGLAAIAAQLASDNDTSTQAKITSLLQTVTDPTLRDSLNNCMRLYQDASFDLSDSLDAFESGDYDDAKTHLRAALNAPFSCQSGFQTDMPLVKENGDLISLIKISLTLLG